LTKAAAFIAASINDEYASKFFSTWRRILEGFLKILVKG
jgi:hypothetical protein